MNSTERWTFSWQTKIQTAVFCPHFTIRDPQFCLFADENKEVGGQRWLDLQHVRLLIERPSA
jgi:hypothetical protein